MDLRRKLKITLILQLFIVLMIIRVTHQDNSLSDYDLKPIFQNTREEHSSNQIYRQIQDSSKKQELNGIQQFRQPQNRKNQPSYQMNQEKSRVPRLLQTCPSSTADVTATVTGCGTVWGQDPYTTDSSPGQTAKHAGLLTNCQTGIIRKTYLGWLSGYVGSISNMVTSQNFAGSFCGMSVSIVSMINSGSTCFCASYSGSVCDACMTGYTVGPLVGGLPICVPSPNYDANCITYAHTCRIYACTTCASGYTAVDTTSSAGNAKRCMLTSGGFIRDCLVYQVTSTGVFQCQTCSTTPNPFIAAYTFILDGVLAQRCLDSTTEYFTYCSTYSFISNVYKCINCSSGYVMKNVSISSVNTEKCLDNNTQIVPDCTAYSKDASNNIVCDACAAGFTHTLISGKMRCFQNNLTDPNCLGYVYTAPNIECGNCKPSYTASDVYNGTTTYKRCLLTSSLLPDCSVHESLASGGYQCYQCTTLTIQNNVFNAVLMKRCIDSATEYAANCAGYSFSAGKWSCSTCNSGFTLMTISGVKQCLPNAVIDPQCTGYILNGANYQCSGCNSLYTLSSVFTATGTYKYCLLTSTLIRDCIVYEVFSGGHQCNQCGAVLNVILVDSLFDGVQMKRCLNSISQTIPNCSGYIIGNPYLCNSCNTGFTLKPISSVPTCLPNSVIDSECSTYILNGANYECSSCSSSYTVSNVFKSSGTQKQCLLTSILIRDCSVYQSFSGGYECYQCLSLPNIAKYSFIFNGVQMNRCLNSMTEFDSHCSTYEFISQVYYCTQCLTDYAVKANSGGPVSSICVECSTVTYRCVACSNITTCTKCLYPYIVGQSGACDRCQAGFQYVDTLCVKPVGCQSFLPDYSKCLACFEQYHFVYSEINNSCVCDVGYKTSKVNNKTVCVNQCGDGILASPEQECDDMNVKNNDGCDQTCKIQKDFQCTSTSPSSCKYYCKIQSLLYNYAFKYEDKNRCRFSFSLYPTHPVFQYIQWQNYLHLNVSTSDYVVPNSLIYSYEVSTQQILVQFDFQESMEGIIVQAKFSSSIVPVSASSVNQDNSTLESKNIYMTQKQFTSVSASSSNTVVLEITSIPSQLLVDFKLSGINAALIYEQNVILKAYQAGSILSIIISVFILLQFFIGSYVHKMIGLETLQILQLLFFARVIVDQKFTYFLQSMNFLKYAAYGGYSNYSLIYNTDSPEAINLSYMTVDKKFLSAGLMKFFTLNVNLTLTFPALGLIYFTFVFTKKYYKRNRYLQNRYQSQKDEYTILRRSSQWVYDHLVFPLINIFNFVAFFCSIVYLQSLQNASQLSFNPSSEIESIESSSFIFLSCTLFIAFFVYGFQTFASYEEKRKSNLTERQKASIPQSLIQKLEHDQNNPDRQNYKPGYVMVYLTYYLIVQVIIMVGVFITKDNANFCCEIVTIINFIYLVFIWKWKPYCINVNVHNKVLRLNHFTSFAFLFICLLMKWIKCSSIVWVLLFYFIFLLLIIVGVCGFVRIYLQHQFRVKMKEDPTILTFEEYKFNRKKNDKSTSIIEKSRMKQKLFQKNPFLFENQLRQYYQRNNLPQLKIEQIKENEFSLIKRRMNKEMYENIEPNLILKDYFNEQYQQREIISYFDPMKIGRKQYKKQQKSSIRQESLQDKHKQIKEKYLHDKNIENKQKA